MQRSIGISPRCALEQLSRGQPSKSINTRALLISPSKAGPSAVLTLQSQLLDRASMLVMKVHSSTR